MKKSPKKVMFAQQTLTGKQGEAEHEKIS